ncbi:PREDICTED: probable ATP-dependent RNA helicase DHX58 [Nanorana parkeri]|uniref:probable ATP-dependent RNA helicase DHX58 n=1 Tax=Nanorana parkeri TaxID=125878 RepID=UPI000854B011|nr:PREDICTED: probable ATP-dependent RNA helicase DHX58 [Nanorana parkeri]
MELRSYQWEVIMPALEGKNIIIWLPTGSGKTRAAMYVAMRHLEMRPHAKVAMIVNKVHLVHQHFSKEFEPHLRGKYRTIPISGDTEQKGCFANFVKKTDVIICTAQILYNALQNPSEEKHVEITDFTLLIIDECHHTQKDAIYNKVMQIYLEKKLKHERNLPQILGLTASPGTGGASSFEDAEDHILQICANLDTWKIMSAKVNIEDLEAKAKQPNKQYDLVPERDKDPFGDKLKSLMATINEYLGENGCTSSDFGTQMYEQKVVEMEKEGAVEANRMKRTCALHLRKYNDALFINDTVRMQDAYESLERFFIEERFIRKSDDPTDVFLCRLFSDNSNNLLELSRDKNNENPKLLRLEEILKEHFQSSSGSRGIIFTRTRESTYSLHDWITSNSALKELKIKSAALTGAGFSNQTKHMTQNEQQDVIERFRNGSLNLLVSTSVAEEGLDIPQCNIVVRYGLMTNEISMVQARGRARAEDSCYSFLAKSGGKESRREMTNESLEDLMKRVIDHVQKMPEKEYGEKILDLQLSSLIERQVKQAKVEQKKKFNPQDVRLDCRNCVIAVGHGNDFRVVEGIHHVNVNPNFKVYYEEYTAPVDLGKKMEDWVPGGAIRCRFCERNWGIMMIYKGVSLPTVGIKNFIITTPEGRRPYKQWKDVPFPLELFNYNQYCEENNLLFVDDDDDDDD